MAGDWIPIRHSVPADEKTWRVKTATGCSLNEAFGAIVRAWLWADVHTTDGHAPMLTVEQLDHHVGLPGCAQAMIDAGWLLMADPGLRFPAFERHMGESARKRELNAARVRKHRAKQKSVTASLPTITSNALQNSTEEKREEKKKADPKKPRPKRDFWTEAVEAMTRGPMGDVRSPLNTPAFQAAWLDWIGHQRERGKVPTPRAVAGQIRKAEAWGEARAIEAIRHSIAGNYQGLFEPKGTKPETRTGAQAPPGKWEGR